jgi:hypothetical protein
MCDVAYARTDEGANPFTVSARTVPVAVCAIHIGDNDCLLCTACMHCRNCIGASGIQAQSGCRSAVV